MGELVAALGTTPARQNLLFGLLEYRKLLGSFGYTNGVQFIDGSFVENVETREAKDPGDIDVFSFMMLPAQYRGNDPLWQSTGFPQWAGEIVNQNLNKQRYGVDRQQYEFKIGDDGPVIYGPVSEDLDERYLTSPDFATSILLKPVTAQFLVITKVRAGQIQTQQKILERIERTDVTKSG